MFSTVVLSIWIAVHLVSGQSEGESQCDQWKQSCTTETERLAQLLAQIISNVVDQVTSQVNQTLHQQQNDISSRLDHLTATLTNACQCRSSVPQANCMENNGGCDVNAACSVNSGNITCTCNSGYIGDGTICAGQVFRPSLTHVIEGNEETYAVASLNDQLFVVRYSSTVNYIEVYYTSTFQRRNNIIVAGAIGLLRGLAVSPAENCLYVSDFYENAVYRVNLSTTPPTTTDKWWVEPNCRPFGLSVNRLGNVLVAGGDSKNTKEFTPNGSLVREVTDSTGNNMWHTVELNDGTWAVSGGGVRVMTVNGTVLHSYTAESGFLCNTFGLAVDGKGFVLVAEICNRQIVVLNPTLSEALALPMSASDADQIFLPFALWLDESRGRLYVAEQLGPLLVFDGVSNLSEAFDSQN